MMNRQTDHEDIELMSALAGGNPAALARLYDRHADSLFALALHILRDRTEAEDLLHDVFLEVWHSAASFDPNRGRVFIWLAVRMRSRSLDVAKSARRVRRVDAPQIFGQLVDESSAEPGLDDDRVHDALASLPPTQRSVVELAYFAGLSFREVSMCEALPLGTVKSRMATALAHLRRTLGPAPVRAQA